MTSGDPSTKMEFTVALEVRSRDLSVEDISRIMGTSPDGSTRSGEKIKWRLPRHTTWWIGSGAPASANYNEHLSRMFSRIASWRDSLERLQRNADASLSLLIALHPISEPLEGRSVVSIAEDWTPTSLGLGEREQAILEQLKIVIIVSAPAVRKWPPSGTTVAKWTTF
jgi:hypothetical protein